MLEVTCAIIQKGEQILICQRSATMKLPLKWEFPGGKVEAGETNEECIVREIKEELSLDIEVVEPLTPVTHEYPEFEIRLYPYACRLHGGELKAKEHAQAVWISIDGLDNYDWAEADLPIVLEMKTVSYLNR